MKREIIHVEPMSSWLAGTSLQDVDRPRRTGSPPEPVIGRAFA